MHIHTSKVCPCVCVCMCICVYVCMHHHPPQPHRSPDLNPRGWGGERDVGESGGQCLFALSLSERNKSHVGDVAWAQRVHPSCSSSPQPSISHFPFPYCTWLGIHWEKTMMMFNHRCKINQKPMWWHKLGRPENSSTVFFTYLLPVYQLACERRTQNIIVMFTYTILSQCRFERIRLDKKMQRFVIIMAQK